jgi:hypothetical protein
VKLRGYNQDTVLLLRTKLGVAAHLSRNPADATWLCHLHESERLLRLLKLRDSSPLDAQQLLCPRALWLK